MYIYCLDVLRYGVFKYMGTFVYLYPIRALSVKNSDELFSKNII